MTYENKYKKKKEGSKKHNVRFKPIGNNFFFFFSGREEKNPKPQLNQHGFATMFSPAVSTGNPKPQLLLCSHLDAHI